MKIVVYPQEFKGTMQQMLLIVWQKSMIWNFLFLFDFCNFSAQNQKPWCIDQYETTILRTRLDLYSSCFFSVFVDQLRTCLGFVFLSFLNIYMIPHGGICLTPKKKRSLHLVDIWIIEFIFIAQIICDVTQMFSTGFVMKKGWTWGYGGVAGSAVTSWLEGPGSFPRGDAVGGLTALRNQWECIHQLQLAVLVWLT